jgi:hypothetical protein
MTGLRHIRTWIVASVLTALTLAMAGCQVQPAKWSEIGHEDNGQDADAAKQANAKGLHVVAVPSQYVIRLGSHDIVTILRSVGYSDAQILDIGASLRDALAQSGMAQIMMGKKLEATVQVLSDRVMIVSAARGAYDYNLRTGQVGLLTTPPGQAIQQPQPKR